MKIRKLWTKKVLYHSAQVSYLLLKWESPMVASEEEILRSLPGSVAEEGSSQSLRTTGGGFPRLWRPSWKRNICGHTAGNWSKQQRFDYFVNGIHP